MSHSITATERGSKEAYLIELNVALALIAKMGWNQLVKITGAGRDYRGHVVFTLTQNRVQQTWERQWFALLACGNLAPLGDHGDYEAAEAPQALMLEVIWLVRRRHHNAVAKKRRVRKGRHSWPKLVARRPF